MFWTKSIKMLFFQNIKIFEQINDLVSSTHRDVDFQNFLKTCVCASNLPSRIRIIWKFRDFDGLVVPQTCFFEKVDFCCGDRCLLCFWFKKVNILKFFRVFLATQEILELKHYVQDETKPLTSQNHTYHSPRTIPQTVRFGEPGGPKV